MTARVREATLSRIVVVLLLCTRNVQICAGVEAEIDLNVEGNGFHRLETVDWYVNNKWSMCPS